MATASTKSSEVEPAKKSNKKLMMIIIVLVLLLIGGGAAGWFFFSNKQHSEPAPVKAGPPVFIALEPAFTVNLQQDQGGQYLQAGITLQTTKKEEVDLLKLHMPQVRSRVIMLLSSKKASDILSAEGKNKLAQEIIEQVNQPFAPNAAPQSINNVFFTSFVIQ